MLNLVVNVVVVVIVVVVSLFDGVVGVHEEVVEVGHHFVDIDVLDGNSVHSQVLVGVSWLLGFVVLLNVVDVGQEREVGRVPESSFILGDGSGSSGVSVEGVSCSSDHFLDLVEETVVSVVVVVDEVGVGLNQTSQIVGTILLLVQADFVSVLAVSKSVINGVVDSSLVLLDLLVGVHSVVSAGVAVLGVSAVVVVVFSVVEVVVVVVLAILVVVIVVVLVDAEVVWTVGHVVSILEGD